MASGGSCIVECCLLILVRDESAQKNKALN